MTELTAIEKARSLMEPKNAEVVLSSYEWRKLLAGLVQEIDAVRVNEREAVMKVTARNIQSSHYMRVRQKIEEDAKRRGVLA